MPQKILHNSVGYFTSRVIQVLSDGRQLHFHSRWHRKGLAPITVDPGGVVQVPEPGFNPWLRFWAPQRLAWWISLLFIIGSACFIVGSFISIWPQLIPANLTGGDIINMVFFAGSLFFTMSAWLQFLEAINGDVGEIGTIVSGVHRNWRWFAWKPHNAGFCASLIQLIGTFLFNANTADAMLSGLTSAQEKSLIWIPDFVGSVCFLLAGYLVLIEVGHRFWSYQYRKVSWWIAMINMLGSIAFMLSALFGFFVPGSNSVEWAWGANFSTLFGASCFLLASYLLIPELFGAALGIAPTADLETDPDSKNPTRATPQGA